MEELEEMSDEHAYPSDPVILRQSDYLHTTDPDMGDVHKAENIKSF